MEIAPKILVRGPNWLGDQVMARSAFEALRVHYPESKITLLSPEGVSSLHFDLFDQVLSVPRDSLRGLALRGLIRQLSEGSFDLSLSFPSSYSSALLPFLAGVPVRVGYAEGVSSLFLTGHLPWPGRRAHKHKTALYLDLVEYLCGHKLAFHPVLPLNQAEGPVVVAPGASIDLRVWPYFLDLIPWLCEQYPLREIVIVGSTREKVWNERLAGVVAQNFKNRISQTSVSELTELCRRASLVVANDAGVAHIAGSLAGAVTLVLFGPGDPHYVQPLGPNVFILRQDIPCSPCESANCRAPYGYQRCLRILTLGEVQAAVREHLAETAKPPYTRKP